MRPLDAIRRVMKDRREFAELVNLYDRMQRYAEGAEARRNELCLRIMKSILPPGADDQLIDAVWLLCQSLLTIDSYFHLPKIPTGKQLTLAEIWQYKAALKRTLVPFEQENKAALIEKTLTQITICIMENLPALSGQDEPDAAPLSVPLYTLLPNPATTIEKIIDVLLDDAVLQGDFFRNLRRLLEINIAIVSGIDPAQPEKSKKPLIKPTESGLPPETLIAAYLNGTPFPNCLQTSVPFSIPYRVRFEHTHIVGGSGHGKTQLLQHMILRDLLRDGSIVVIDSQGDMIRNITHMVEVAQASDRLVIIDPNDVEHPPALNLFDLGLERLNRYSPVEREKLINGAIALYEYLFGALLGAELTQRQGVIFRFLARLMMTVKGATIHTLMEFMDHPDATRPHLAKLDPVSQRFFETQFFSKAFDDTRQRILTRLWGVVSMSVLERMFASTHNKLDLFDAMNRGSIILINTAKDLLKQEGCEILGRFFIALITQAVQERAIIPEDRRKNTFLYIDEAHDYFDDSLENIFNQARKYKVGIVIAHQNLDQFESKLRATVMASTSIKMVGGLSAKDASVFAREMRCEPEFLQGMRKRDTHTEFACFVRNHTPRPIPLTVPFGEMERRPQLTTIQHEALLERNRKRYSTRTTSEARPATSGTQPMIEADFEDPDVL